MVRRGPAGGDPPPVTEQDSRAPRAGPLSPARALAGAAVSVCGVVLGIGTLLWVTDDPSRGQGPTVQTGAQPAPLVQDAPLETETAPSDPPAVAPPTAVAPGLAPPVSAPGPVAPDLAAPGPVSPGPVPPGPVAPGPAVGAGPDGSAPAGRPARPVVPITVLNNSRRTGLAARAAARFERGGWPVAKTGNFRGQIPVTTVYYDPGLQASARAFAAAFDGVVRVRPRFATLPARGVVVVLTNEFAA